MDLNKVYYDEDGNAKTIFQMVKKYPEWAANRIQEGEKDSNVANALLADVRADIKQLFDEYETDTYGIEKRYFGELVDRIINKVSEYFR